MKNVETRYMKSWRRRNASLGVVLVMVALFFVSQATFTGVAQIKDQREKRVGRAFFPNEPIEIVDVGFEDERFHIDQTFMKSADWLKDFSIKFRNSSGKTIASMWLQLEFPETMSSGNLMVSPLTYGPRPWTGTPDEKFLVSPDATFQIKLNEKRYKQLKAFIERRQVLDSLTQVNIKIMNVYYDDGTGWNSGQPVKLDPKNPGKYILVNANLEEK